MKKSILGGIAFFLILSFANAQGISEKFKTEFKSYNIDNSTCVKLTHSSGSKIFIQDYAFGIENSNIEIRYREFINPLDMLVNNIPMTTSENGKKYQLESGGMFEIRAFKNNQELQLSKGKNIEVQLAVLNPSKKMSKMKAFKMPDSFDGWDSKTNTVHNNSVGNDYKLWGSSEINNFEETNEENWGDFDGWGDEWTKQDSIRKVAFQTMEIDEMGFYNYDYKIEDVDFVPIAANFNIDDKATKNTIYIVYNDLNTVFYYPEYTWKNDFKIIKEKTYKLFSIDEQGKISILENKPNLSQIENKSFTFELNSNSNIPQNRDELESTLNL